MYIVEMRSGDNRVMQTMTCFLTHSMKKSRKWIKRNINFSERDFLWWWAIIKIKVDDEYGGDAVAYFDWDGNKLNDQPLKKASI